MSETWKQWEGQIVNGEFSLLRYLGGSRHSAVFLTGRKSGTPQRAAIKLVPADPSSAESQLQRWKHSAQFNHSHMIRIFESGRCEIDGTLLLFVVMEAAEEDLSQILPERALVPSEVMEMLPPVLEALAYIHGQGMVHGRLRPSNILASGDQVKVSADTLRASGERVVSPGGWGGYDPPESSSGRLTPASDMWSLAITLVQALTQQRPLWHPAEPAAPSLPENTPGPFAEIARRCLQVNPQERWTVKQIQAALEPKPPKPPKPTISAVPRSAIPASIDSGREVKRTPWVWLIALVAAAVVITLIVLAGKKSGGSSSKADQAEVQSKAALPDRKTLPQALPAEAKPSPGGRAKKSSSQGSVEKKAQGAIVRGAVLQQVLPRVPPSARQTIQGRFKVAVRVTVDPAGTVTDARLISPGPSKYFARLSLEAAREWKFTPAQVQGQAAASQWNLTFIFRRSGTDVASTQTTP